MPQHAMRTIAHVGMYQKWYVVHIPRVYGRHTFRISHDRT